MVWIELCILLACILVGARVGGIGLGTVAGGRRDAHYVGLFFSWQYECGEKGDAECG